MSGSRLSADRVFALVLCLIGSGCKALIPHEDEPKAPPLTTQSLPWAFQADGGVIATSMLAGAQVTGSSVFLYLMVQNPTPSTPTLLVSTDGGVTFTNNIGVFSGRPFGLPVSVVNLPDGRQRAYSSGFDMATQRPVLTSATSSNGRNWTAEPGTRMTMPQQGEGWTDVAASSPSGPYRAFYVAVYESDRHGSPVLSAVSTDGLTFTTESEYRIPWLDGGQFRFPSVVHTGNEWLMVVTKTLEYGDEAKGGADLWLATSTDGLKWTVDSKPLVALAGGTLGYPALVMVNGVVRLYYTAFPGQAATTLIGTTIPVGEIRTGTIVKR